MENCKMFYVASKGVRPMIRSISSIVNFGFADY